MSELSEEVDTPDMGGRVAKPETILPEAPPVVMDDEKFEEEERGREEAFSDEPVWKGRPLQPFSYSRKALFYSQRLAMGTPHLGEVLGDSMAFLGDAARILYLCSHDPRQYRHLRSQPLALQDGIDAWADEQITNELEALLAVNVALRIFNGSEINQPEAVPGPRKDDDLGN